LQQELIHAAEEAFDLAVPARNTDLGENQLYRQISGHLFQMLGSEVGAMVAVKDRWNATDMPARIFFVPDGLTKRERGRQGSRFLKAETIADNGAAVVIFDYRELRLGRLSRFIEQPHVKEGMDGWACHIVLE
jgi:hypothetical protein